MEAEVVAVVEEVEATVVEAAVAGTEVEVAEVVAGERAFALKPSLQPGSHSFHFCMSGVLCHLQIDINIDRYNFTLISLCVPLFLIISHALNARIGT